MKLIPTIALVLCGLLLTAGCTTNPSGDNSSAPNLKIAINHGTNDGENLTNNRSVTISLWVSNENDQKKMALSNDNTTWSDWVDFKPEPSWTLSTGDGVKTVYMKTKDKNDKVSNVASDTIVLDMTRPTIVSATPGINATGVWYDTPVITVTFSEEIRPVDSPNSCPFQITTKFGNGPDTSGEKSISKTQVQCRVTKLFRPNVTYSVDFTGDLNGAASIQDLADNFAKDQKWTYKARPASFVLVEKKLVHDDRTGTTHIYGVVKNQDNCSFKNVDLQFSLLGGSTHLNSTLNSIIEPNAQMPFYYEVADAGNLVKDATITIGPNYEERELYTTEVPYNGLSASNLNSVYVAPPAGYNGGYTLTGDVTNKAGGHTVSPTVLAIFGRTDPNTGAKSFICTGGHQINSPLGAGMSVSFTIELYGDECNAAAITDYTLFLIADV
jgi:hypothetical protein